MCSFFLSICQQNILKRYNKREKNINQRVQPYKKYQLCYSILANLNTELQFNLFFSYRLVPHGFRSIHTMVI